MTSVTKPTRYVWFKLTVEFINVTKCDKAYKVCLVHIDSKVHQCNKCGKAYKVCLVHTDSKVHQCNKCDKAYKVKECSHVMEFSLVFSLI